MGAFDQLDKPGTDSRPGYFDQGTFDVTITGLSHKESKDPKRPRNTDVVIATFLVATSTNANIRPGDARSYTAVIEPNEKGDRALADVKCLLIAACGVDPSNKDAVATFEANLAAKGAKVSDMFKHATSEGNPFAGRALRLVCTIKKLGNGNPFTVHTWQPAPAAPAGV